LLLLVALGISLKSNAQDAHFSQFYNNPIYYNPAYAGLNLGLKTRLNYKRQWVNVPGEFDTYNFSMDIADRNIPGAGGIGLLVNSDKRGIGYSQTLTVGIAPSVRIPLASNFVMQVAPLLSYVRRQVDWEGLIFSGQLDDVQGNVNPSTFLPPVDDAIGYPDFGFGVLFQVHGDNTTATFGASGSHLTEPNQSFFEKNAPLKRRYVGHGDVVFDVGKYKG
jgi:type IX secretion system PorP/SprF family membrane protein